MRLRACFNSREEARVSVGAGGGDADFIITLMDVAAAADTAPLVFGSNLIRFDRSHSLLAADAAAAALDDVVADFPSEFVFLRLGDRGKSREEEAETRGEDAIAGFEMLLHVSNICRSGERMLDKEADARMVISRPSVRCCSARSIEDG